MKTKIKAFAFSACIAALAAFAVFTQNAPRTASAAVTPDTAWYTAEPTAAAFEITTAGQLAGLAQLVNAGTQSFTGKTVALGADIDLAAYQDGEGWETIGINADRSFKGTFDGGGKTISNLKINLPGRDYVGFFGYVFDGGTVKDLILENADIRGNDRVGGITGMMQSSTVSNCSVTGEVKGRQRVGGIAGSMNICSISAGVRNCSFDGAVTGMGTGSAFDYIGGIAGYMASSMISQSFALGSVSGRNSVGGIVGHISSSSTPNNVLNCYYIGDVTGNDYVGGIAGDINMSNNNNANNTAACYAGGTVSGRNYVGGIAGYLYNGKAENCVALNESITASAANPFAARAIGYINAGTVTNVAAFSGMEARGNAAFNDGATPANLNGADIDAAEIKSDGTLGDRFKETTPAVWYVEPDKLPDFNAPLDMPLYLQPHSLDASMFAAVANVVYNGSAHMPAVTAKSSVFPKVTFNTLSSSDYSKNINAGTAEITITGTGNYAGEVTLTFEIEKAAPVYTVPTGLTLVYSSMQTISSLNSQFPYDANSGRWAWINPYESAGDAGIKFFLASYIPLGANADNYLRVDNIPIQVTVTKYRIANTPRPAINGAGAGNIYTGSPITGVSYPSNTLYTKVDGEVTETEHGDYYAVFRLNDPANYMWANGTSGDLRVDWSIGVAEGEAEVVINDFEYNGFPAAPTADVTSGDWARIIFEYNNGGVWSTSPHPANAGTYTVRAVLTNSPDGNYADYQTAPKTFTISQKPLTDELQNVIGAFVYNGAAQTPVPNVHGGLAAGVDYDVSYSNNINAGTATLTITGKGNYSGSLSKTFLIGPKPISFDMFNPIGAVTYDGSEHKPAPAGNGSEPNLTFKVDGATGYINNINAGTAFVTVTGTGNYTGTAMLYFTINKAAPSPVVPGDLTAVYGDSLSGVYLGEGWAWNAPPAASVGNYGTNVFMATFTPDDTANYTTLTASFAIMVARRAADKPTVVPGLIYDGTIQNGIVNYNSLSPAYSMTGTVSARNQGNYSATFTLDPNYIWTDDDHDDYINESAPPLTLNWSVAAAEGEAEVTIEASFIYDGVYTGTRGVVITKGDWTVTIYQYSADGGATWGAAAPVNAGSYSIRALLLGSPNGNYADFTTAAVPYTISPKQLTDELQNITGTFVYDGGPHEPAATVTGGLVSGTDYEVSYENNTGAGTATVKITGKGNYAGTLSKTFVIARKPVDKPAAVIGLVFDGNEQEGVENYDPFSPAYVLTDGTVAETGADDYSATFTLDKNYIWADGTDDDLTLNWSISASPAGDAAVTITGFDYDGVSTGTPGVAVTTGDWDTGLAVYEYRADGAVIWSTAAPVNAGTYYIRAILTGSQNFADLTTAQVQYEITKRPITVTPKSGQEKTCGDTDPALTYDITAGSLIAPDTLSGSLSRVAGENAGGYEISIGSLVSENPNYEITLTGGVDFTINKKQITSSMFNAPSDVTYNGAEHKPTVTVTLLGSGATFKVEYLGADYINAGQVSVTITGEGNYDGTVTLTFEIKKANPSYGVPFGLTVVYSDDKTLADVSLAAFTGWTWDEDTLSIGGVGKKSFSATFAYSPDPNNNYNTVTTALEITVTLATGFAEVIMSGFVYGEPSVAPEIDAGTLIGDWEITVFEYRADGSGVWSVTAPVNAGDYFVRAKLSGSSTGNYAGLTTSEAPYTIQKADPSYTVPNNFTTAYDLDAATGKNRLILGQLTLPDGWSWDNPDAGHFGDGTNIDAGDNKYWATFTPADAANFNTIPVEITVVVTPARIARPMAIPGLTYTGNEQVGVSHFGGMLYSLTGGIDRETDKDSYSAEFTLNNPLGATNFIWANGQGRLSNPADASSALTISWSIAGAAGYAELIIDDITYGETPDPKFNPVNMAGDWADVIYLYRAAGSNWRNSVPVNAGAYEVRAVLTGSPHNNFADFTTDAVSFEIKPKELFISPVAAGKVYGEDDPALAYAIVYGLVGADIIKGSLSRTAGEDAGDYEILIGSLASENPNYDITLTPGAFTITPKTITAAMFNNLADVTYAVDPNTGDAIKHTPAVTLTQTGAGMLLNTDYGVAYGSNTDAGDASVIITGTGNYAGNVTLYFKIERADPSYTAPYLTAVYGDTLSKVLLPKGWAWNAPLATSVGGFGTNPFPAVFTPDDTANYNILALTFDIVVSRAPVAKPYSVGNIEWSGVEQTGIMHDETPAYNRTGVVSETDRGVYSATFTLNPNYIWADETTEPLPLNWAIVAKKLTNELQDVNGTFVYKGSAHTPVPAVPGDLELGTDYTVSYTDNINAGTATLTITGIGNYSGTLSKTFTISKKALTDELQDIAGPFIYNGGEHKPAPALTGLTSGTDYTVSYTDNTDAGTATLTITGIGNYSGTLSKTFEISPKTLSGELQNVTGTFTYSGNEHKPAATVTGLAETDYTVSYANNVNAGTATLTITGKGNYAGTLSKTFTISPKALAGGDFNEISGTFVYNGSARTPAVSVKSGLVEDKDYYVSYADNVNAGTAVVTVKGMGNYSGTITLIFTIDKADAPFTLPSGLAAEYGQTLASVSLPVGWAWALPQTTSVGDVGNRTFEAAFTPQDANNYKTATRQLSIAVTAAAGAAEVEISDYTLGDPKEGSPHIDDTTEVGDWTVIVYEYSADGKNWTTTAPAETGGYLIRAKLSGSQSGNYKDLTTLPTGFTVNAPSDRNGLLWLWFLIGLVSGTVIAFILWFVVLKGKEKDEDESAEAGGAQ